MLEYSLIAVLIATLCRFISIGMIPAILSRVIFGVVENPHVICRSRFEDLDSRRRHVGEIRGSSFANLDGWRRQDLDLPRRDLDQRTFPGLRPADLNRVGDL